MSSKVDNANRNVGERRGSASKCSVGAIAGRRSFPLTDEGRFLFGRDTADEACVEMLFTRGDMVQSLPPAGVSLCGNDDLPNEACAYFASGEEASQFRGFVKRQQCIERDESEECKPLRQLMDGDDEVALPYAITFQAHPEYMTTTGYKGNFVNTVEVMKERGAIGSETCRKAQEDADANYDALLSDSLDATVAAATILGWFQP